MSELNGQSWKHMPPAAPNSILFHHAQTLGRIEATILDIDRRLTRLEKRRSCLLNLTPQQWVQVGLGSIILAGAILGRITWGEALPSLFRLAGVE